MHKNWQSREIGDEDKQNVMSITDLTKDEGYLFYCIVFYVRRE
jgi:hypothetical protein